MGQTRRFGEHICRNVLGNNRTTEVTFDEMLATLKDKINGYEEEKEFIDEFLLNTEVVKDICLDLADKSKLEFDDDVLKAFRTLFYR